MQIIKLLPLAFVSILAFAVDTADLSSQVSAITGSGIFSNIEASMEKVYPAMVNACYICGYFLIAKAIFKLKKLGHKTAFMGSSGNLIGPIALILLGVILINTPAFIKLLVQTMYNNKIQSTISWSNQQSGQESWFASIIPIISLVQVIGIFAFLRGVIILTKACNENAQPGNIPKGLMHILGGVMAINITGTIDLINSTLGL